MDELEAVWGPQGRATVDPASVRPVPPEVPATGAPGRAVASFEDPVEPPVALGRAGPPAGGGGDLLPTPSAAAGRVPAAGAVAGAVVVAVVLLAVAVGTARGRGSERAAPASAPATTIVSAAADLLGRGSTTTVAAGAPVSTVPPLPPPPPAADPAPAAGPAAPAPPARPAARAPAGGDPALVDAEGVAQRFIDAIARRDCDGLWSLLGRTTQAFLTSPDDDGHDGRTMLCDGLRTERELPVMRVHGPAAARADGAAVVTLESEGELEDLVLLAEDGRWVVDLFGAATDES